MFRNTFSKWDPYLRIRAAHPCILTLSTPWYAIRQLSKKVHCTRLKLCQGIYWRKPKFMSKGKNMAVSNIAFIYFLQCLYVPNIQNQWKWLKSPQPTQLLDPHCWLILLPVTDVPIGTLSIAPWLLAWIRRHSCPLWRVSSTLTVNSPSSLPVSEVVTNESVNSNSSRSSGAEERIKILRHQEFTYELYQFFC